MEIKMGFNIWCICIYCLIFSSISLQGECSICGDFITVIGNSSGEVSSPGYPNEYPNSSYCVWLLEAPVSHVVELNLTYMYGEGSPGACQDYIEIRDGSSSSELRMKACSANNTVVTSGGRWMWIKFLSDSSGRNIGFHAIHTGIYSDTSNQSSPIATCQNTRWQCRNKECVELSYRCDDINDCGCTGYSCDEDGCQGLGLTQTDRIIIGVTLGTGVFFITFFGIGFYEIWAKKAAQKKYEKEMEERKKREKLERAKKQAASLGIPGMDTASVTASNNSGSRKASLNRTPSGLSGLKTTSPTATRRGSSLFK